MRDDGGDNGDVDVESSAGEIGGDDVHLPLLDPSPEDAPELGGASLDVDSSSSDTSDESGEGTEHIVMPLHNTTTSANTNGHTANATSTINDNMNTALRILLQSLQLLNLI